MKKKKLILLLTSLTAVTVSLSVVFSTQADLFSSRASDKPSTLACEYYFDENNGYTSIYDINTAIINNDDVPSNYKTWGTISCVYYSTNLSQTNYYVQSTDKYGNSAGIVLYNCNNKYLDVGNVITITGGTISQYNGQQQISKAYATLDYTSNPYPIECREVTYSDFRYTTVHEREEKIKAACTYVGTSHMRVLSAGSTQATLSFDDDGSQTIIAYYGSFSDTNAIKNILEGYIDENEYVNICGHMSYFSTSQAFQLYIRSSGYITPYVDPVEDHSYIEIRGSYVDYYNQYESLIKPTVYYVDPDNEIEYQVTSSCEYSYDFSTVGYQAVEISYHLNGRTYKTTYLVYVNEADPEEKYVISISPFNQTTSFVRGDSFIRPDLKVEYNTGIEIISSGFDVSGFKSNELGRQKITLTFGEHTTSYDVYVYSSNPTGFYSYDMNSSTFTFSGKYYSTGNYGAYNELGYYRAINGEEESTYTLIPYGEYNDAGIEIDPQQASIYNVSAFRKIRTITVKYSTSSNIGSLHPRLYFGENSYGTSYAGLEYSKTVTTASIDVSDYEVNYFKINGGDTRFTIYDLFIEYDDIETSHGSGTVIDTSYTDYRLNPTTYSGYLVDGYTSVSVPIDVTVDTEHDTYTVNEYKTYTYYTFEFAEEHPSMINEIAMTDPVDVANYYNIFGEIPANYAQNNIDEVKAVFGDLTRTVSRYTKTTGYAQYVPYAPQPGGSNPVYYEFDIAISSSYSTSQRGAGRLIGWKYGFESQYGYNSQPVSVYTDDHYSTFQEFNNMGGWCTRYDAEKTPLLRRWKQSITLN